MYYRELFIGFGVDRFRWYLLDRWRLLRVDPVDGAWGGIVCFLSRELLCGFEWGNTLKGHSTRYGSGEEYTRLFEKDFSLFHRGNVKTDGELFNNPHQD